MSTVYLIILSLLNMKNIYYLACPYSKGNEQVRIDRFNKVTEACSLLTNQGFCIFSPITHSHPMVEYGVPSCWDFWKKVDTLFISVFTGLIVLQLDGWLESTGVQEEIVIAESMGKPVIYVTLEDIKAAKLSGALAP